jgi:hypothetical protein
MLRRSRPVSLVNGRIVTPQGIASSLRFSEQVIGIEEAPRAGDEVLDLDGAFVLPGLINAHDHLELNHYGRLKHRERYENAAAWIDDLRPSLREDPRIRANSAYPLYHRLFIGGLKNLLAGATTVAHHNPIYREMNGRFPVRVVNELGWAHSFLLEDQPVGAGGEIGGSVRGRREATPDRWPFIVHVAEGVDAAAAEEVSRLDGLGCLRRNTVLVHGVAVTAALWQRILEKGASLIWCPASNLFLFGQTIPVRQFLDAAPDAWTHLCLGSDSRLTGARDLLDEIRTAVAAASVSAAEVMRMVTLAPARVLKLSDAGQIAVDQPADLLVIPGKANNAGDALLAAHRADVLCVTLAGRPIVGAQRFSGVFKARRVDARAIGVDGVERLADRVLARDIARCPIQEEGVTSRA